VQHAGAGRLVGDNMFYDERRRDWCGVAAVLAQQNGARKNYYLTPSSGPSIDRG